MYDLQINEIISLISLIKERPELWNPKHDLYNDFEQKDKSILEISKILNHPRGTLKKEWENLLSIYNREIEFAKMNPSVSIEDSTWIYMPYMGFLDNVVNKTTLQESSALFPECVSKMINEFFQILESLLIEPNFEPLLNLILLSKINDKPLSKIFDEVNELQLEQHKQILENIIFMLLPNKTPPSSRNSNEGFIRIKIFFQKLETVYNSDAKKMILILMKFCSFKKKCDSIGNVTFSDINSVFHEALQYCVYDLILKSQKSGA